MGAFKRHAAKEAICECKFHWFGVDGEDSVKKRARTNYLHSLVHA